MTAERLHVLLDCSAVPDAQAPLRFLREGGWCHAAARVDLLLPRQLPSEDQEGRPALLVPHTGRRVAEGLFHALQAAAQAGVPLVVLSGRFAIPNEVVPVLRAGLAADPLFGTAQPFFADANTDRLWSPWEAGRATGASIGRDALPAMPVHLVTGELPSACLMIRASLVPVLAGMWEDASGADLAGLLAELLCRARRRGFRNVCCSRAVVPTTASAAEIYPALQPGDAERLTAYPERDLVRAEDEHSAWARLAPIMGRAVPRSLLLDCRGLAPFHNGTSQNILGQLRGLREAAQGWEIDVLCGEDAATFHQLEERFPDFRHIHALGRGRYGAALHLSQPWFHDVLDELHQHALVMGFNFLDTIAWDVGYAGTRDVGDVWRFAARHADVITFISHFSRDRFHQRFRRPSGLFEAVAHLSLSVEDYVRDDWRSGRVGTHVLLFGNSYDHKDVASTLDLLTRSFPRQPVVVIGAEVPASSHVRAYPSGNLDEREIHSLVSSARVILYPSFYEGFGLPVVEGLSYGRPVLARASPLWQEIAAHSRLPGDLVTYTDDPSLVETLGRLLGGLPVDALPRAGALAPQDAPANWAATATVTLATIEAALSGAAERWLDRDIALQGWRR